MTKVLRTTGLVLGAILTLVIVAGIILMTWVSPNNFKPLIASQVLKYTGRQLTIDGDLSWSLYPFVGFKVGHMSLSNPPKFNEKVFAEVNKAEVGVRLLPLLQGQISTDGISLSGLKLNLIRNADGSNNWQDLQNLDGSTTTVATNNTTVADHSDRKLSVEIPSVDITDAQINWLNIQANQVATIKNFQMHAKDIYFGKFFSAKTIFDYASPGVVSGHAAIDGKFKLDLAQQNLEINNLAFTTNVRQGNQKITVNINGHSVVNFGAQTLKIDNLTAKLANLEVTGELAINQYASHPQISANFQAKPFDLKQLLVQATGKNVPALQAAKIGAMKLSLNVTPTADASLISALALDGQFKIDELRAVKLTATKLETVFNLKNSKLAFSSITGIFYQGNLTGNAGVDLAPTVPAIHLEMKIANVQAEPLLRDLEKQGNKMVIKGVGQLDLNVDTAGLDNDALTRNLNGTINFSFKDGQLEGVNLGYLLDSAYALVKRQPSPAKGEDVTNFGTLSGTGTIHDGIVTNKDFTLDSPRFSAKGDGTVDLVNQKIDFNVKASTKDVAANHNDKDALNLYALAIPLSISGSLDNPSIRINAQAILQEVAEQHMKDIQNKVGSQLKDKLPGKAGDLLQNILGH